MFCDINYQPTHQTNQLTHSLTSQPTKCKGGIARNSSFSVLAGLPLLLAFMCAVCMSHWQLMIRGHGGHVQIAKIAPNLTTMNISIETTIPEIREIAPSGDTWTILNLYVVAGHCHTPSLHAFLGLVP